MKKEKNTKHSPWVTIIIIAAAVVLLAVLIPVMGDEAFERKKDIYEASNMNNALGASSGLPRSDIPYEKAVQDIKRFGQIIIPCNPLNESCSYYWMPSENRVVLYDEEACKVIFPKEYAEIEKAEAWVCLTDRSENVIRHTEFNIGGRLLPEDYSFSDALNHKSLDETEEKHLPVYLFNEKSEAKAFLEKYNVGLNEGSSKDAALFKKMVEKYSKDSYYKDKALFLVLVYSNHDNTMYDVNEIEINGNTACVKLEKLENEIIITMGVKTELVLIEVSKSAVKDCAEFDAILVNP